MFLIEQLLAEICELFTGPDRFTYVTIKLKLSMHRRSMMHDTPAV